MTFREAGACDVAGVTRVCNNLQILFTYTPQFSAIEIVRTFSRQNAL